MIGEGVHARGVDPDGPCPGPLEAIVGDPWSGSVGGVEGEIENLTGFCGHLEPVRTNTSHSNGVQDPTGPGYSVVPASPGVNQTPGVPSNAGQAGQAPWPPPSPPRTLVSSLGHRHPGSRDGGHLGAVFCGASAEWMEKGRGSERYQALGVTAVLQ